MNAIQCHLDQALPIQAVLIRSCFACPCFSTVHDQCGEWDKRKLYESLHGPKDLDVSAYSGSDVGLRHPDCPPNVSHITLLGASTHGH